MKKTIQIIATFSILALFLIACDPTIHEYPAPCQSSVIIEPHVNREPPLYYKEVIYDEEGNSTVKTLKEVPAPPYTPSEEYQMRIILDIYQEGTNNSSSRMKPDKTFERNIIYTDKDALPPQSNIQIDLPEGDYHVLAWADYVYKDCPDSWHYYPDTLTNVKTNLRTYPEHTHHRSTAAGQETFAIDFLLTPNGYPTTKSKSETPIQSRVIPIDLERPSGRYRVIASDFTDFINNGGSLENATIKVIYKQYVSVGYNVATQEPNMFVSTYSFNTHPEDSSIDTNGDLTLFCDYLFTSYDKEDNILADFYFYDAEGNEINHSQNIKIPLKRNHETVIRGCFLTRKIGKDNNIDIDENFEGEYIITL